MTRSDRLREKAKAYDDAMKRAEALLAMRPSRATQDAVHAVAEKCCKEYLRRIMDGATPFYDPPHFGWDILEAFFAMSVDELSALFGDLDIREE